MVSTQEKLEDKSVEELLEDFKKNKSLIDQLSEDNKRNEEQLKKLGDPKNSN